MVETCGSHPEQYAYEGIAGPWTRSKRSIRCFSRDIARFPIPAGTQVPKTICVAVYLEMLKRAFRAAGVSWVWRNVCQRVPKLYD